MRSSCAADTTGPMSTSGSKPPPMRIPRDCSMILSPTWSWTLSWTSTRVLQVQTCPEAPHTPIIAVADADSRSASGKMISGLLPPSSRLTRLTRAAAAAWIARPVSFKPVNVIASTPGWATMPAPTVSPVPWTRLNTPGGLHDDAVAGAEGEQAHRGCRHRPVPRDDRSDHAERLAHLVDGEVVRHRGDAAVQLRGPPRVVVEAVDRELDDEPRVHAQQTGVDDVELSELVPVLGDQSRQPPQPPLLLERRQVAPAPIVERRARGPHRALDVRGGAGRRGRDLLAGGRIDHRHRAAVE